MLVIKVGFSFLLLCYKGRKKPVSFQAADYSSQSFFPAETVRHWQPNPQNSDWNVQKPVGELKQTPCSAFASVCPRAVWLCPQPKKTLISFPIYWHLTSGYEHLSALSGLFNSSFDPLVLLYHFGTLHLAGMGCTKWIIGLVTFYKPGKTFLKG